MRLVRCIAIGFLLLVSVGSFSEKNIDLLIEEDYRRLEETADSIDSIYTMEQPSREAFYWFCRSNSILYPEVVWAQARQESGNFTSTIYETKNNCLGLYNSKKKSYMSFSHWTDCLIAYRDRVQYRYSGSSDNTEEYLSWLTDIGYAEDPEYITKVRNIMRRP